MRNRCIAYLCRVKDDRDEQVGVALCIATESASTNEIKEAAVGVFRNIFNESAYLDIVFLNPAQEKEIETVCRPFLVID